MRFPVLAVALSFGLSSLAVQALMTAAPAQDSSAEASKAECLKCHTYEDVIKTTAAHVTRSGEKVNPHRYIEAGSTKEHFGRPHEANGAEHIPQCASCHTLHPIPPAGVDRSKINVDWCYSSCHHQNDFTRCSVCHQ